MDGGTAGTHYSASYGCQNAFDGVCVHVDVSYRWLGEIKDGVRSYLKLSLPEDHPCKVDSYRLWRVNTGNDYDRKQRAPTAWKFFGIKEDNTEVELSNVSGNLELLDKTNLLISVTNDSGEAFVAFKWVPSRSYTQHSGQGNYTWAVGLTELEIFVKDISAPSPAATDWNLRDFIAHVGLNATNYVDSGLTDSTGTPGKMLLNAKANMQKTTVLPRWSMASVREQTRRFAGWATFGTAHI